MRVLIITQKVDRDDPVLGFFHEWIRAFSGNFAAVTVICLEKGRSDLPAHIQIHSLGKETKRSRLRYLLRFYSRIWRERNTYDAVFVHMNEEYMLLGAPLWKVLGKKVGFWRNHAMGGLRTRLAIALADAVFCTSPQSYTAQFSKTRLMPVGVDTEYFSPRNPASRTPDSILCLGRISPVKNIDLFIGALALLDRENIRFRASIIGSPVSPRDTAYDLALKDGAAFLKEKVVFEPAVAQSQAADIYRRNEVFVNLTGEGSFDKTIIEAMACETLTLVSNSQILAGIDPEVQKAVTFKEKDPEDLARKIMELRRLPSDRLAHIRKQGREFAVSRHSLAKLAQDLSVIFAEMK